MELLKETSALERGGASGATLVPIMSAVFIGFLVIGIAIPVLPLHVHQRLGQSTFLVGLVADSCVPPQDRGLAMGAYTAFLDVALGFGTAALGLLANFAGLGTVFLVSAMAALCAAPIAASFLRPFTSATAARLTISR